MADGASADPTVFVIGRELNEVHLLLDNLAANPATNLSAITADTRPDGLDRDWIDQICRINWPPDKSDDERARQAALLIRAKDYLNSLTYPASGASIAFTLLVTQGAKAARAWRWPWRTAAAHPDEAERLGSDGSAARPTPPDPVQRIDNAPSRRSMAADAYPDLVRKAQSFRYGMGTICMCMVLLLAVTCGLSWYVAFGNSQLATYAAAEEAVEAAQKQVAAIELRGAATPPATAVPPPAANAAAAATGTPAAAPRAAANTLARFAPLCGTLAADTPTDVAPRIDYLDVDQYQACAARAAAEDGKDRALSSLGRWLAPIRRVCPEICTTPSRFKGDDPQIASDADAIANILGAAVLPFFYGVLGAAAAVIRSLSRKVKYSLLTPRDLVLSLQQLALGAVTGASIALFFGQTNDGQAGLLGPAPLSASALSFVAGFGVDAVFQTLEALILRIFNVPQPAKPAEAPAPPSPKPATPPAGAAKPAPTPAPAPAPAKT